MEKDPARRYADADAFADDIERELAGEPILARPASMAERVIRRVRKRPALYAPATALTASLVGGVVLLELSRRSTEQIRRLDNSMQQARERVRAADLMEFEQSFSRERRERALGEAERLCEDATALRPDYATGWYEWGGVWMARRRWDRAIAMFDACLERDPGYVQARPARARARVESIFRIESHTRLGQEAPAVFVPLNHPPGRDAEVDWGERPAIIAGKRVPAQIFVMRACHSGLLFVRAYPNQRQEAFFDAMQEACRFFGGVFHRWTFDNLTQAVRRVLRGRTREEQDAFRLFRSHFLFDPLFTLPGIEGAHEKGGVEGGVGYVGRNWFVPAPQFKSWEELNTWLLGQCRAEMTRTAQGKTRPIGELFADEQPMLLPLPAYPFDCCRRIESRADAKSRVRFENNHYSVPVQYALGPVTLKAYWDQVVLVVGDRVIAAHRRRLGRGEASLTPEHYLPMLERKPALWDYGEPFVRWKLPAVFAELRQRLESADPRGLKAFLRVIQAVGRHDLWSVTEAVGAALAGGSIDVDSILSRLDVHAPKVPDRLAELVVPVPDPNRYNTLLSMERSDGNESAASGVPEETAAVDDRAGR